MAVSTSQCVHLLKVALTRVLPVGIGLAVLIEVEAGQELVVLEEGELRARLNQANEAVLAASASATEAQAAFDRT